MGQPTDEEFYAAQRAMHEQEARDERRAWSAFLAALDQAADIAISNYMQRYGDGEGGVILYEWQAALERHLGGPLKSPPKPRTGPKLSPPLSTTECLAVFDRDGYRCRRCGTQTQLTVDHKTPRSKGGTNDPENLQTLCRPCNTSKGTKDA